MFEMKSYKCGFSKGLLIGQLIFIISLVFVFRGNGNISYEDEISLQLLKGNGHVELKRSSKGQISSQEVTEEIKSNSSIRQNISLATKPRLAILSAKTSEKFQKQDEVMKGRLAVIRQKCSNYMEDDYWLYLRQGGQVLTYEKANLHYCIIPKVGCTFWKRIMRFLGHDYPENKYVQRPSDIDRNYVHYGGIKNLKQWSVQNPISRMLMTNGKSLMFARDPFTRLWSAYIDKFLLPDFWRTDALAFVKKLRPNATEYERRCANNVTFHEFLTFINLTHRNGLNEHWQKLHRLCSPCHVQYDVIGKQESFGTDADYILTKFDLDFLKENTTRLDMVHEEVTTLTSYNFKLENAIREGCFRKIDIAKRLWLAFQYNGYIDRNTNFPRSDFIKTEFITNPTETFIDVVLKIIENQSKKGINLKQQKRTMMLEAYRKIPKDLLKGIIHVYDYDFELFGYERNLFGDKL